MPSPQTSHLLHTAKQINMRMLRAGEYNRVIYLFFARQVFFFINRNSLGIVTFYNISYGISTTDNEEKNIGFILNQPLSIYRNFCLIHFFFV